MDGIFLYRQKDTAIKNAKVKDTVYKLPDEKGMYLLVSTSGGRYFRLNYRFDRKRKTLALGVYPEISLKQARDKRDEARSKLAEGIDPLVKYAKLKKLPKPTLLSARLENGLQLTVTPFEILLAIRNLDTLKYTSFLLEEIAARALCCMVLRFCVFLACF